MKKIFCVEDDESIRELIEYTLNSMNFECTGFCDGSSFFEALQKEIPHLILLDIMLPDKDGFEILSDLKERQEYKNIPIIMLTAKTSQIDKIKGLDKGADDYITKPFDIMELISRINAVLRRTVKEESFDTVSLNEIKIHIQSRKVYSNGSEISLTYKEFEILKLLLTNKGVVLTRDRLMNEIWGTDFEGESRTVDVHIRTLRQKLGDSGKYIETVRNVGYKVG